MGNFLQIIIKASVKFYDFNILFWTPLDGYVWSMEIIFWNVSYFKYWKNWKYSKRNTIKNESCKSNLGNR